MGSNQSKPEKKGKKSKSKKKAPPMIVVGEPPASFENTSGLRSHPVTWVTPVTPPTPVANPPPAIHVQVHELEGHPNISRPPPPSRMRHLSELIDPADLPRNSHVRSPSGGNLLGAEEYLAHPDRPMSVRERRENILRRVNANSQSAAATAEVAQSAGNVSVADRVEDLRPTQTAEAQADAKAKTKVNGKRRKQKPGVIESKGQWKRFLCY